MNNHTSTATQSTHSGDVSVTSPLLDCQSAANYLGISASFLAKRRLTGDGPQYAKIGRRVMYAKSALEAFLAARLRQSTSE